MGVLGDGEEDDTPAGMLTSGIGVGLGLRVVGGKDRGEGEWDVLGGARQLDFPLEGEKPIIGIWPIVGAERTPEGGASTGAASTGAESAEGAFASGGPIEGDTTGGETIGTCIGSGIAVGTRGPSCGGAPKLCGAAAGMGETGGAWSEAGACIGAGPCCGGGDVSVDIGCVCVPGFEAEDCAS